MLSNNLTSPAAKPRQRASSAGGMIGILLCALLIAGPMGNAARAQPQTVRKNGGIEVTYYQRAGCGSYAGPVRIGPPKAVPRIRFTVAATLTVEQKNEKCGSNPRTTMFGLSWRFFVPNVAKETKILILYFKHGDGSLSATAYRLK